MKITSLSVTALLLSLLVASSHFHGGNNVAAAPICELGQVCDDSTTATGDCIVAGMEYQPPMTGACGGESCPAAVHVWEQINENMNVGMMDLEYTGNPDIDFVRSMIPHHIGAVSMCDGLMNDLTCTEISDIDTLEGLGQFCSDVQLGQEFEVDGLRAWLEQKNLTELAPCSTSTTSIDSMSSMGMTLKQNNATGGDDMKGMTPMMMVEACGNTSTSSSQMLVNVSNEMHDSMAIRYTCDHSLDFARQMIPHHAGAVAMCDVLLKSTEDEYLKELCGNITSAQQAKIIWVSDWLAARNGTIPPCGSKTNLNSTTSGGFAQLNCMSALCLFILTWVTVAT